MKVAEKTEDCIACGKPRSVYCGLDKCEKCLTSETKALEVLEDQARGRQGWHSAGGGFVRATS